MPQDNDTFLSQGNPKKTARIQKDPTRRGKSSHPVGGLSEEIPVDFCHVYWFGKAGRGIYKFRF